MSKNSLRRYTTTLFVLVVSVALVGVDLVVLAQNANSADEQTRGGAMISQNGNISGTSGNTRRRRGRRRARSATTAAPAAEGEPVDLSGTYPGTVNYPEAGLNGPVTLTITGNSFTITPEGGGSPVSGRVTAVTTRKYTGVTMMFGNPTAPPPTQNPPPPPLPAVSLQASRSGDTVTLKSVPGEKRQLVFSISNGPDGRWPKQPCPRRPCPR